MKWQASPFNPRRVFGPARAWGVRHAADAWEVNRRETPGRVSVVDDPEGFMRMVKEQQLAKEQKQQASLTQDSRHPRQHTRFA
jgi:hypothetical protein